jgi:pSer/pThr/pTyr-binding forkhead associated (FHA) protein
VVVLVDASLSEEARDQAPVGQPPQTFPLSAEENLVGREGSGVKAHVPVHDVGVSRRHALLIRRPDGGLLLRDLGSSNGTRLNGTDLSAEADVPVRDGDSILVGAWTRIAVRAVLA